MAEFALLLTLTTLLAVAVIAAALLLRRRRRRGGRDEPLAPRVESVVERVRTVGKLVGLEVHAKEIATATSGVSWLPPAVLSRARLAMIFTFERQYWADLSRIGPADVEPVGPGRFRLRLPEIEGMMRLVDVKPYDIQQGRVLGLLDVIQMNADRQAALTEAAQDEAGRLFERSGARYRAQAMDAVERQLSGLMGLMGVEVEVLWPGDEPAAPIPFRAPAAAAG